MAVVAKKKTVFLVYTKIKSELLYKKVLIFC